MMKRLLFAAAFAAAASPAAAFDFSAPRPLAFAEVKSPAVSAPAPVSAAPKACKPFLLSSSFGGVNETVILERACTPENEPVWAVSVEIRGRRPVAVKVSSADYPAEKAALESRIKSMVVDGIGQADADFIVSKTGPALKQALAAPAAEQEKLLVEATEALKTHLARP